MRAWFFAPALPLLLIAALAAGCDSDAPECRADADCTFPAACLDGVCRGPADAVEVNPRLQALEREDSFVSLERDGDLFRFYLDRPADALGVRGGDLIVGRNGGGYLRRVEAVEAVGKTLELQTTIAPLSDALRGEVQLHFGPDDGLGSRSDGLGQHRQAVSSCSRPDSDSLCLDLSGQVLFENDNFEVSVIDGRAELRPELDISYVGIGAFELPVHIEQLEIHLAASFDLNLDVQVTAKLAASETFEQRLGPEIEHRVRFAVGGFPVWVTFRFTTMAGLELSSEVSGQVTAGYEFHQLFDWSARYLSGEWSTVGPAKASSQEVHLPEYELAGQIEAKVFIKPELEVIFYETLGAGAFVEGYLKWIYDFLPEEFWQLLWGVAAGLELELGWLADAGLIEPPDPWTIYEREAVLAEGWSRITCDDRDRVVRTDPITGHPAEVLEDCSGTLPAKKCLEGECYVIGQGVIAGRVSDALDGESIKNALVEIARNGQTIASLQTASDGTFTSERLESGPVQLTISKSGYLPASTRVEIRAGRVSHVASLRQLPSECESGLGGASGTIRDAATGAGMAATCRLRQGRNARQGSYLAEFEVGQDGRYAFPEWVPAGAYTLEASRAGYSPAWSELLVCGGRNLSEQDLSLAPVDGRHRLVLEWGKQPADLDLHLFTPPVPPGLIDAEAYHVFFREDCRGSLEGAPRAELENDDQDGRGPETIAIDTFYDTPPDRPYTVEVHNYSQDNGSGEIADLASSGAALTLYGPHGAVLERFTVPSKSEKSWWHVCDLQVNDGRLRILPVDAIEAGTNPDTYPGCWPPGQDQP